MKAREGSETGADLRAPARLDGWLTIDELNAQITALGLTPPSRDQRRRWTHEQILPAPQQVHVPGQAGSTTLYPPETVDWVAAVTRLQNGRRPSVDWLRFELWWDGLPVPTGHIRAFAVRHLEEVTRDVVMESAKRGDVLDFADAAVRALPAARPRNPTARLFANRTGGRAGLEATVFYMAALMAAGEPILDAEGDGEELTPAQILDKAFGLERGRRPPWPGQEPWAGDDANAESLLAELRANDMLSPNALPRLVSDASNDEILQARPFAHTFLKLSEISTALERLLSTRDVMGWGQFAILGRDRASTQAKITALCSSIYIHRISLPENVAEIEKSVNEYHEQLMQVFDIPDTELSRIRAMLISNFETPR